jgi:hypothetical protein
MAPKGARDNHATAHTRSYIGHRPNRGQWAGINNQRGHFATGLLAIHYIIAGTPIRVTRSVGLQVAAGRADAGSGPRRRREDRGRRRRGELQPSRSQLNR